MQEQVTQLQAVQKELAEYYAARIGARAGLKADRQMDLDQSVARIQKESAIDRDEAIRVMRTNMKQEAQFAVQGLRKEEGDARRALLKEYDAETNRELSKMKTKITRLIVSIGVNG